MWFQFAFSWWWVTLNTFCVFVSHLYVFFGKMSIQVLCPFLNQIVCFLLWSSLYILDISLLLDRWFANIFSHSIVCLIILSIVFFPLRRSFLWCSPTYWFFCYCCLYFWCHIEKTHCQPMSRSYSPVLSSSAFVDSDLTFNALIHFKLIFVSGVR